MMLSPSKTANGSPPTCRSATRTACPRPFGSFRKVAAVYGAPRCRGNPLDAELLCADNSVAAACLRLVHRLVGSIDQRLLRQTMLRIRRVPDRNRDLDRLVVVRSKRRCRNLL